MKKIMAKDNKELKGQNQTLQRCEKTKKSIMRI